MFTTVNAGVVTSVHMERDRLPGVCGEPLPESDALVLFDMTPLTPTEVIRRRGVHPLTMLPLDPDETHTCGNCATRRWIFDETGGRWHDTVCAVLSKCEWGHGNVVTGAPMPEDYCEDECCTAWDGGGDLRYANPWPWDSTTSPDLPACSRWTDLETESVVAVLAGRAS